MINFEYHLPVNLILGAGKTTEIGVKTACYGTKALVVTGQNSTKKSGLLGRVVTLLHEAGAEAVVFDQVTPNPLSTTAEKGKELAVKEQCDVVVAVGGGSIIDCAKAIAFMVKNDGDIFEYIYGEKNGTDALPLIALPTTCGTGSEGNCFAVLTNPDTGDKKSLRNIVSVPKASIIDPELMITMPRHVAASVMFDALCHNMEAYLSRSTQPLVEIQALHAVQLLTANMTQALESTENMDAWSSVCFASTLGGMCINNAGVILPHGMEHPASGLRDIVHGRGLAALAPVIYEATVPKAPEKFEVLAGLMGGKTASDFVPLLKELIARAGLTTTLSKEGVKAEDVDWMTDNCLKVSAAAILSHPVHFEKEKIKELYLKAL